MELHNLSEIEALEQRRKLKEINKPTAVHHNTKTTTKNANPI